MHEIMLRVANVASEADLEAVRDAVDRIGADYEHVDSEPDEGSYPRTAYFQIQSGLTGETSPKTVQRPRGARDGRTAFHGEKPETVELAANLRPWHPSRPTFGSLEGEACQGGRGGA